MTRSPAFAVASSAASATVAQAADRALVVVTGEFDESFAPSAASVRRFLVGLNLPVDLDLSGLTLLTASGVRWLVALYDGVPAGVTVVRASGVARTVLEACGVPMSSTAERTQTRHDLAGAV